MSQKNYDILKANRNSKLVKKVRDYVEERMQQIDELADKFKDMKMFDDVRQADIKGRSNELIKVYELLSSLQ